ncbi:MAG: hypothetical protein CVU97_03505 [Firmicutes bacterium HGW-Firmicutes-21]|nr:MAG: hypothetical protein CVU97_03505 [Firmicutes bacterium HGW-Firmicutes-21]
MAAVSADTLQNAVKNSILNNEVYSVNLQGLKYYKPEFHFSGDIKIKKEHMTICRRTNGCGVCRYT